MDTAIIISSMTSAIVARVGPHSEVAALAKHSTVPVINALCNDFHPLQQLADLLTISETRPSSSGPTLGLEGLKIAWVGDANNVLYDMCIGAMKMGINMAVATPSNYSIPKYMKDIIQSQAAGVPRPGTLTETTVPEEAIRNADIIVTDTWISMGQEAEAKERLKAFEGYQVTNELAKRAGAKEDWQFMHCLPRHQEEVNDEVFYGPRSVVFREGENRLWTMICE
jgi:ornithine carbamoyltransferase